MASNLNSSTMFLVTFCLFLLLATPTAAFGAGNIPSIAQIEGMNFRHGDIEDMLKTVAFIKGHKWTTMMIKRVYFGNWLRDYSQAVDVGSLKGVSAPTIRILVWVLSFLSFGYATEEFEVTEERLGVYRPEEHIDNPKDYADNSDARQYDTRLRGLVQPIELEVDLNTGMKNYIANESGGWATSAGYVKFSFARSIHFGRLYTNGAGSSKGKEADLCEALRCFGQGLHCMEDFGAHTNYCELALRELGFREVFPHCGVASEVSIRGHHVYPLVTGTFGAVDFLHSVLGEATDHFTQTEVEEMDLALKGAEQSQSQSGAGGQRGLFGSTTDFAGLLSQVPGMGGGLADTARDLSARSAEKEYQNEKVTTSFSAPPGNFGGSAAAGPGVPGMSPDFDPIKTAKQIYPILEFRDKVVRAINATIAKIPGLEALVEKISETLSLFILSLLAPFVRPIIEAVSKSLKTGSSTVRESTIRALERRSLHEPHPLHALQRPLLQQAKLRSRPSSDNHPPIRHSTHPLRVGNPGVPVEEVLSDILRAFHHPALRDEHLEIHRNMFATVRTWVDEQPDRHNLNSILSSQSVKAGRNHTVPGGGGGGGAGNRDIHDHSHGSLGGHGKTRGSIWSEIQSRDLGAMEGTDGNPNTSYLSTTPQPGTSHSPGLGYQNVQRPGSSNHNHPQGEHLNPGAQGGYQQQQPYGPPGGYQNAPYPTQQPSYGGPPPPPPGSGPPYPGQYPPQQPQYPPQQPHYPPQPPYGDYPPYPPSGAYGGYQ